MLALLVCMFATPAIVQAQQFHGATILKTVTGPGGAVNASEGDTVTAYIRVLNTDDFACNLTINEISDVVHHASGDVATGNLLAAPVILVGYGSYVDVSHNYTVEAGDNDPLRDTATCIGVDPVVGQFNLTYPGLINIIHPDIDIEKYVSVDGGITWEDADTSPGPTALGNSVSFRVVVCNNGTDDLTNVVVNDTDFTFTGVATSLAAGECDNSTILIVPAVAGQHYDLANVTAWAGRVQVYDEDPAYYRTLPEVGGTALPVNKLRLLAPWAVLLGCAGVATLLMLRKRRQA